jgi:single-stranded DNA-binding protein
MYLNVFFLYGKIVRIHFFETKKTKVIGAFVTLRVSNYAGQDEDYFSCVCYDKVAVKVRDDFDINDMVIISGKTRSKKEKIYDKYYDDVSFIIREIKKLSFNMPNRSSSKESKNMVNPFKDEQGVIEKKFSIDKLFDI